jgi:MoxR-like ATPase
VRPEDIQSAASAVLGHRMVLDYAAMAKGQTSEQLVERLLDLIPVP